MKKTDGKLVRVEVTDVLGHVGVQEPRGQSLKHPDDALLSKHKGDAVASEELGVAGTITTPTTTSRSKG